MSPPKKENLLDETDPDKGMSAKKSSGSGSGSNKNNAPTIDFDIDKNVADAAPVVEGKKIEVAKQDQFMISPIASPRAGAAGLMVSTKAVIPKAAVAAVEKAAPAALAAVSPLGAQKKVVGATKGKYDDDSDSD